MKAKVLEELLILFAVIFEHGEQLGFDLLLQPGGDHLELAVMLEHFAGNVQGEILRIHQALDKAEVIG